MCVRCARELPLGALVCDQCHTLVHAETLERLATGAKALEGQGEMRKARDVWAGTLKLLPSESTQSEWVRQHLRALEQIPDAVPGNQHKWAKKLGPLAPIALMLAKGKFLLTLFQLKFLVSLGAFMGVYWALFGAKFGIGFAVLILIHEMGHYIDVKLRGLPADLPVFLPGLGAYVRWEAMGVSEETRAAVSLAGPLAGWVAAAACALVWWKTGSELWAALARAGAWLNVLNLIPIWILDGGQAIAAVSKTERFVLLTASVALWLFLGESVFFLVAAGVTYRLFTKDIPEKPSTGITAYFVAVAASLGFILWLIPGKGFGLK